MVSAISTKLITQLFDEPDSLTPQWLAPYTFLVQSIKYTLVVKTCVRNEKTWTMPTAYLPSHTHVIFSR
jgi:hypothetical protein